MVATKHHLPAQVGLDILQAGGTAVDAAIATNAAIGFFMPNNNGLGGDLFAIVWSAADGRLYGLNASGRSPRGLSLQRLRELVGDDAMIPDVGPLTVSVPGAVDGWFELHERWGRLPMAELLAPTIRYAREGAPVHGWGGGRLSEQPGFAATFLPDGRAIRMGEVFRNPDLAATLEAIAAGGRDAFYRGETARRVDTFCRRVGCYLRYDDFAEHQSEWVDPLGVAVGEFTVWQLPPNTQGVTVLQMLRLLEGFDLANMGHNSAEYLHHLIEAKKIAYEDRARFYADPAFAQLRTTDLISDEYSERRRRLLNPRQAARTFAPEDPRINQTETIYLTVGDSAGNMVSLIQSNYSGFGSGLVPDGTGFGLQNRGALFALDDDHANVYAPGKRPFHTIIPGFVTLAGAPYMSFGVSGGDMQPQGQVQVLLNHLLFGMDVQLAGDAPRFRHEGSSDPRGGASMTDGGCVLLERAIGEHIRAELRRRGHTLCEQGGVGGGYQAVLWDAVNNVYWGASESRQGGQAAGW